jgi:fructokinase
MTRTALVVGEALIDVVMRDGLTIGEHVGGSPLNVAVGLARLGRQVDFLTWIGDDERGRRIAEHLRVAGAHLADGSVCATRTATALATLDENGSATYLFDLEWRLPTSAQTAPLVMHTGSIATVLEPGCTDVAALIDAYSPAATITFDPNVRPPLIDDPNAARARIESVVTRADVVKASDEDLRWVEPGTAPDDVAARWLSMGPAIVAVTQGSSGAYGVCRTGTVRIPAHPADVVDTVGAGDAFMAGLIDALWSRDLLGAENRDALRAVKTDALRRVLDVAALSSALTVARAGADLPDRATRDHAARVAGHRRPIG